MSIGEACHLTLQPSAETAGSVPEGKASPHYAASVQPIPVSERRFTHMQVDIVHLLPTSAEGFTYLFSPDQVHLCSEVCGQVSLPRGWPDMAVWP